MPTPTTLEALWGRYPVFLLDAYGVLVDADRALPGAAALIQRLERERHPYFVLTNDASRLPERAAAHYQAFGLPIPAERVITAGSLLSPYFADHRLAGARVVVFGTPDSARYVELAGGIVVEPGDGADVIAVCDEAVPSFLPRLDAVLSDLLRAIDLGKPLRMVLANPDLIYPKAGGGFGIAAGSVAAILEQAITLRSSTAEPLRFTRLGKPHEAIFEAAAQRAGHRNLLMIGDQLDTDILGACRFGIDSVLVATGISRWEPNIEADRTPTWLLDSLG